MVELSDNELMLLVKTGDLNKMSLLFSRHHRQVYHFLYHMTHDKPASEDMVQNVFYRMLKYRHTYSGKGEFSTWMFHLTRNILKDEYRKLERKGKHVDFEQISENTGGGDPADWYLDAKQGQQHLFRALEKLNRDDREILVLNKFQELKYAEIAKLLNITEGAVKVRIHRALTQLRSIYKKLEAYGL